MTPESIRKALDGRYPMLQITETPKGNFLLRQYSSEFGWRKWAIAKENPSYQNAVHLRHNGYKLVICDRETDLLRAFELAEDGF